MAYIRRTVKTKLTRRRQQAAYVDFLLQTQGLNQRDIAERMNVGYKAISQVILGNSTSRRIQQYLADTLGFEDWDALLNAAPMVGSNGGES